MKEFYPQNLFQNLRDASRQLILKASLALIVLFLMPSTAKAQQVYNMLEGDLNSSLEGVTPFGTVVKNQRSQYLYISNYLQNLSAPTGYITSLAVKVTQVAAPSQIQPHNLQIKMGLTSMVSLPANLLANLPVHYSKAVEPITETGWYTFELDTPFHWDGFSNIVVEFCRTNASTGTNYEVEVHLNLIDEYRTAALLSNASNSDGCSLTGNTNMTLPNRRLLPSMRVTMSNPCETNPVAGTMVVSEGNNYCSEPFTLSATGDSIESGLFYQWQSSFTGGDDFVDIPGANAPNYTTSQEFSTYYRRGVMCEELGVMVYPPAILVAGDGCFCNPTVTNMDATGITNVTFGMINSTSSSNPSYTDFRNLSTIVQRVGVFPLSARVTATTEPLFTKAWIDWNQDGIFSATESYELGMVSTGIDVSSGINASVAVPVDALLGETVMRVRTASVADMLSLEPCGNTINGESEDYKIIVENELSIPNSEILKNSIIVFADNKTVNIKSTVEGIDSIKVYDLSGRLLFSKQGSNERISSIALGSISSQILIIEIKTESGFIVNKKVSLK